MGTWVSYAPMLGPWVKGLPISLAEGVSLAPVPDWLYTNPLANHAGAKHQAELRRCKIALAVRFEAESLGSPDPEWLDEGDGKPGSAQRRAEYRLSRAALALWLHRPTGQIPTSMWHTQQLLKGNDWIVRQALAQWLPILQHPKDSRDPLTAEQIKAAGDTHRALLPLRAGGSLSVAIDALSQALQANNRIMRFVMCWVSMEALFGAGDAREITYRLSNRVGALLFANGMKRERVVQEVKGGYSWRSKVVHGAGLANFGFDEWVKQSLSIEVTLREVMLRILGDHKMVSAFEGPTAARETFLDGRSYSW